jgi:hypothetical protein
MKFKMKKLQKKVQNEKNTKKGVVGDGRIGGRK